MENIRNMIDAATPDESIYDVEEIEQARKVLDNILYAIVNDGAYKEGNRNNIAVDMTIACEVLGVDASDVMNELVENGTVLYYEDDGNAVARVEKVMQYIPEWRPATIMFALDWDGWYNYR